VAVLIPSIDLKGGKIVQLVQGARLALEFSDFEQWIERFRNYPIVQLIDLDAAMGQGDNSALVDRLVKRLPCQVGGGIGSSQRAHELLAAGAHRVIFGSKLVSDGEVDSAFADHLARSLGTHRLTFAIDTRAGRVSVHGWRHDTRLSPVQMIRVLEPYCDTFLYTHIDTEGLQQGFPLPVAHSLRTTTAKRLIVAGGISSQEEVQQLDMLGIDAVVGMAIYTRRLPLT
jgi:phosphoribosylformimino-5-aminoimidazole carboxamide ribotide isomerase